MSNDESIAVQLAEIGWRLRAIDEWRREISSTVSVLESKVNDLRFTDAVADALVQKLEQKRKFELTIWQKIGGGTFALALVLIPIVVEKLTS